MKEFVCLIDEDSSLDVDLEELNIFFDKYVKNLEEGDITLKMTDGLTRAAKGETPHNIKKGAEDFSSALT